MPDEATEALEETQDTPVDAASQETPAEEQAPVSPDVEKRYNDLRSEFDRRNAALSGQYGPEAQAEALRQFGIELKAEEEADPYDDPDLIDPGEAALRRVETLEQQAAEQHQSQQEAEFERLEAEYIQQTVSSLESKEGLELTDKEYKTVVNNALANRGEDDRPDLEGAFADLKDIQSGARDRYLASKKTAALAPVGTAGEDKINPRDPEARRKLMAEAYDAAEGSEP